MNRFAVILLSAGAVCVPAQSDQSFPKTSESSVQISQPADPRAGEKRVIVNTTFAFGQIHTYTLFQTKIETRTTLGAEGAESKLEVTAWAKKNGRYDQKLWSIRDDGHEGEDIGDFYKTTTYGCCGLDTIQRFYGFKDGAFVYAFTTDPALVEIPNTKIRRHIAYASTFTQSEFAGSARKRDHHVGVLMLSSDEQLIDRVAVIADDKTFTGSPQLSLVDENNKNGTRSLVLMPSKGMNKPDALKNFTAKLMFEGFQAGNKKLADVHIPISSDRFDVQKALLPSGITITRIPIH